MKLLAALLAAILFSTVGVAEARHNAVPDWRSGEQVGGRLPMLSCPLVQDTVSTRTTNNVTENNGVKTEVTTITEVTHRAQFPLTAVIEREEWDLGPDTPDYIYVFYKNKETFPFAVYDGNQRLVFWDANRDGHFDGYGRVGSPLVGTGPCDLLRNIFEGKVRPVRPSRERRI